MTSVPTVAALAVAACHEGPACFALMSSRFTVNPASPSVPTAMVAGSIPAAGVPSGLLPAHSTGKVMVRGVMALGDDVPHPATATTVMSPPAIAANGRAMRADMVTPQTPRPPTPPRAARGRRRQGRRRR